MTSFAARLRRVRITPLADVSAETFGTCLEQLHQALPLSGDRVADGWDNLRGPTGQRVGQPSGDGQ